MLEASSGYPLLSTIWTIFVFFGWVLWIWLLILVYTDLFRRHDMSGWGKAGWVVLTILLPFIGVFIYLIAYGHQMQSRQRGWQRRQQQETDEYIRSVAGSSNGNTVQELAKAKDLLDRGAIDQSEYEAMKRKLVS